MAPKSNSIFIFAHNQFRDLINVTNNCSRNKCELCCGGIMKHETYSRHLNPANSSVRIIQVLVGKNNEVEENDDGASR